MLKYKNEITKKKNKEIREHPRKSKTTRKKRATKKIYKSPRTSRKTETTKSKFTRRNRDHLKQCSSMKQKNYRLVHLLSHGTNIY